MVGGGGGDAAAGTRRTDLGFLLEATGSSEVLHLVLVNPIPSPRP
jgi:hypothetical protein